MKGPRSPSGNMTLKQTKQTQDSAASGADANLLSAVSTLLAAATSSNPSTQSQLAQLLSTALGQNQGGAQPQQRQQAPHGRGAPSRGSGGGAGALLGGRGQGAKLGKWDAVVIPTMCVGWLKGRWHLARVSGGAVQPNGAQRSVCSLGFRAVCHFEHWEPRRTAAQLRCWPRRP